MTNELIEFKDNFLVNFFEETKYNTSKKPGLLKNLFQNSIHMKYEADFEINYLFKNNK